MSTRSLVKRSMHNILRFLYLISIQWTITHLHVIPIRRGNLQLLIGLYPIFHGWLVSSWIMTYVWANLIVLNYYILQIPDNHQKKSRHTFVQVQKLWSSSTIVSPRLSLEEPASTPTQALKFEYIITFNWFPISKQLQCINMYSGQTKTVAARYAT